MGKAGRKLTGSALAEWDIKHPRGADGRYIKAGGTGSLPGLVASGRARARLGITAPAASLRQPRTPVPAAITEAPASPRKPAARKLKTPAAAAAPKTDTKTPADHAAHLQQVRTRQEAADYVAGMKGDEAKAVLKEMGATYIPRLPKDVKQQIVAWVGSRLTTDAILNSRADRPQPEVRAAAARLGAATAPAPRRGLRVQTWEELGKPSGPPPVGQRIGHEGGTYELLPGTPRRYRVIADDGRDISGQVVTGRGSQTADDARTALRMAAYDRQQRDAAIAAGTVDAWDAVPGSWSYDGTTAGFEGASPAEREQIRQALHRWATHGGNSREDASRMAEPPVNRALRGVMPHNDETRADVAALDRAFELSKTKRKITVYRGVSDGTHILPDDWQSRDLTGVQWGGNGYTPVTGNLAAAESYTGRVEDRGFAIRMNLPKGAKAIAIRDAPGAADDEGEIVLPRELTFRVVKDNGAVGDYGIRLLDVEIVPASPASTRGTSRRRLASG